MTVAQPNPLHRPDIQLPFSEEHELLLGGARRFLADRCPLAQVRQLASDGPGYSPELYREMAELGWLTLASETDGSLFSQALLLEEMGRQLVAGPFVSTLMTRWLLGQLGSAEQIARFAPALESGETIATFAVAEPDAPFGTAELGTRVARQGEGFTLVGVKSHVPYGQAARWALVAAAGAEPGVYLVELTAAGVRVEPETCVDSTRRTARIVFDDVKLGSDARLERSAQLERALLALGALLAAEMVGAADALLELTRAYAAERKQFGRAIGSFQAVKHPLVDLMSKIELTRSLALGAAALWDAGSDDAEASARMAKYAASETLMFGAKKAVQLHGGFGFTWDADVHFYFKRALYCRGVLGDAVHHQRALARLLFDTPAG